MRRPLLSPTLRGVLMLATAVLLVVALGASADPGRPLTVYAAASLTDAMQQIGAEYAKGGATEPRCSFAASSVLARQIEAGAGVDIFFSADQDWMDYVAARSLIRTETRRDIVANRLVLIAPKDSTVMLSIKPGFGLLDALRGGHLATGDPDYVPVGKYARSALMTLGAWNDVADRVVRADNVRIALAYVARNEAPLGIVYTTDALLEPRVRVVDAFPEDTHPPIRYPVAALRAAGPEADSFVKFVASPAATAIFLRMGFISLVKP